MSDPDIDPDAIKRSLRVLDITDDPAWIAAARWEVAAGYSKLANPKRKLRMRDIYKMVCEDGYEDNGRSRTLAVLASIGDSQNVQIAGLVRIVLGRGDDLSSPSNLPPLDAMHFVRPIGRWPHEERGLGASRIAELGRFTVVDEFRSPVMREAGVDATITRMLFDAGRTIAAERGVKIIYSIMPLPASEMIRKASIGVCEIPMALRSEDPAAARVFDAFSVYWRRLTPKLFEFTEDINKLAAIFRGATSDPPLDDPTAIAARYGRNVTALHRQIPLVLRPTLESEVQSIVRVANEHQIPIYPFSTGKNWGLGSKLPVTDGSVVIDLSKMNRIVHVDGEYAYAILEPGVTQAQLAAHLREHHPDLTMNFTGSFGYTGIVGNVLERGDGAYARVEDLLGVRGILGNGEPFEAGGVWANVGTDQPSHYSRYVAGPDLCGMFAQSSLGIVTQLAFRLIHRPERRYIVWGTGREENLEQLVAAFAFFGKQKAINPGSVNLGYANRFVQGKASIGGATEPAPPAEWNFYVLVGNLASVADAISSELVSALRPLCENVQAYRVGSSASPQAELPAFLHPLLGPLADTPDIDTIKMIYQLTGTPLPSDPSQIDADQTPFGMKCCIPLVPFRAGRCRQAVDIVAEARQRWGLNIKISFFGDGRTLVTIHFRSDAPADVARAAEGERWMWDSFRDAGFPPYRSSIDQMERTVEQRPEFFALVRQLKAQLDPNGILSPGRYVGR